MDPHLPAPVAVPDLPTGLPMASKGFELQTYTRGPRQVVHSTIEKAPSPPTDPPPQSNCQLSDALNHPGWRAAMDAEMVALHSNKTWWLVPLPSGAQTVRCRWVFAIKYLPDESIERLKARLVAKGYTQTFSVDYQETFLLVAKIPLVRILISLAVNRG
ncbi:putative mitochondrial protein AtMg00820 [Tasmannia lanceolata]|uniref:putative mitochondrial protein AtMg00820 n=1 Tax=Tasmannia lanceolata TaxID=3420 RepID=UPI004063E99A